MTAQSPLFSEGPDEDLSTLSEEDLRERIRAGLKTHLISIGLFGEVPKGGENTKERIRATHSAQRQQVQRRERAFIEKFGPILLRKHFAEGSEVVPDRIEPELCPVASETEDAAVFRFATLLWSVPVSNGYGRRMRYLVRDRSNGKVIGIFGLADPVYNLRARDNWIGWAVEDHRHRLVNIMDAHVVGSVPPYNLLLGGKLVASLMTSAEVCRAFSEKYSATKGIISKQEKRAQLALITVTSALGRSSLYNRLKLTDPETNHILVNFQRIGSTEGWGHFQVPDSVFMYMRQLLKIQGHRYASGHKYGQGPNWRIRVAREALAQVGLSELILRHGISREIYAAPLADNWREYLKGADTECVLDRPSSTTIGRRAVERWILPRAAKQSGWDAWTHADTWALLTAGA